jgi:hypothetical protein
MNDKNLPKKSPLLDANSVFAWIQSVFENLQDKLHPIARLVIYFNSLKEANC